MKHIFRSAVIGFSIIASVGMACYTALVITGHEEAGKVGGVATIAAIVVGIVGCLAFFWVSEDESG